jgi:FMN reductase
MSDRPLHILAVVGSLHQKSVTRVAVKQVADLLQADGCTVDLLDLQAEPLPLLNTDSAFGADYYAPLRARVLAADAFVLGTPDYHGSISSPLKNFLDHFWHEFAGRLFATLVASHEKGLTVHDQLRTVARQCQAWALPYGVSFLEKVDVKEGAVATDELRRKLAMLARDVRVYGGLLAQQRRADFAGGDDCFLARLRKQ